MVASPSRAGGASAGEGRVSIPFIAGQWSLLRLSQRWRWSPPLRFNPLHCGAVVASNATLSTLLGKPSFQSPSLRGSGRFREDPRRSDASRHAFQSPSLRGSGRFRAASSARQGGHRVSIPFIAGQWSLRTPEFLRPRRRSCFNPLHCGAVVASRRWRCGRRRAAMSFNPLHCGAVVASCARRTRRRARREGFNPLHCGAVVASRAWRETSARAEAEFQSPSLRGSGRFATRLPPSLRGGARFNPLHCGAVVASFRLTAGFHFLLRVSIPFIAGQWSLPQRGG